MPLNVKRFGTSCLVVLVLFGFIMAQTVEEVMRQRIARARAYVAVKNYNAAVYELEGIRRETKDEMVQGVAMTMLMNVYLEQGDYRRAQDLLVETYNSLKSSKKPSSNYFSVAGQVIKGSRNQIDRYRQLGLSVTDRSLPTEAVADVEKMRETLEMIVTQSEELSISQKQAGESMALLEESTTARSVLARDDYDSSRWKNKIADARERIASSRSKVVNVIEQPATNETVAQNTPPPVQPTPKIIPVSSTQTGKTDKKKKDDKKQTVNPVNNNVAVNNPPVEQKPVDSKPNVQKTPVANEQKPVVNESKPVQTETVAKVEMKPIDKPPVVVEKTPEPQVNENLSQNTDPLIKAANATINQNGGTNGTAKEATSTPPPPINETPNETSKVVSPTTETPTVTNETPVTLSNEPLQVGSLKEFAVRTVPPQYPAIAKNMRMTGVVKIDFMVDEEGSVSTIQSSSGPDLLKRAAVDALKKWKFKPFTRDGQPVKAVGYVSFNFSL